MQRTVVNGEHQLRTTTNARADLARGCVDTARGCVDQAPSGRMGVGAESRLDGWASQEWLREPLRDLSKNTLEAR